MIGSVGFGAVPPEKLGSWAGHHPQSGLFVQWFGRGYARRRGGGIGDAMLRQPRPTPGPPSQPAGDWLHHTRGAGIMRRGSVFPWPATTAGT